MSTREASAESPIASVPGIARRICGLDGALREARSDQDRDRRDLPRPPREPLADRQREHDPAVLQRVPRAVDPGHGQPRPVDSQVAAGRDVQMARGAAPDHHLGAAGEMPGGDHEPASEEAVELRAERQQRRVGGDRADDDLDRRGAATPGRERRAARSRREQGGGQVAHSLPGTPRSRHARASRGRRRCGRAPRSAPAARPSS